MIDDLWNWKAVLRGGVTLQERVLRTIGAVPGELAEWSWVDVGSRPLSRTSVYVGAGWYCRRLVHDMLENKCIRPKDLKFSFSPVAQAPLSLPV